jgi:hypothetical protein
LFLAKIPIPFVLFVHPAPWVYLLIAVVVLGFLLLKFAEGGAIDPMVSAPAAIFLYASYHMVGAMFTGFGPIFTLGALGSVASVGFVLFLFRQRHAEHSSMVDGESDRLEQLREDGISNITHSLGCTRDQAQAYMARYNNDDTRVVMEARAGRLDKPQEEKATPVAPSHKSDRPIKSVEKIPGSPFNQGDGFALLHGSSGTKDYPKWGKMLASVCEIVPFDAVQKLKAHRGAVIITDLREEVADAFKLILEQDGLQVIKVPIQQLMRFVSAGQVKALTYDEETITIVNHSEHVLEADTGQMMLLTVGVFGQQQGLTGRDGFVETRGGHVGADLFVLGEEEGICYQFALDLSRLSYAHLGDRMANNGLANLRLTIGDLVAVAPQMALNSSVEAFVEKGRARHFKTSQDYGGEVTGLAQLVRARQLQLET